MKRLSTRKRRIAWFFDLVARPIWALAGRWVVPRRASNAPVESILVVELWRLGDFALLTPALRALRARYPAAHLALLGPPAGAELLQESGLVDEVIPTVMPWTAEDGKYAPRRYALRALWREARALRARRFDVAVSARMDLRDNVVMAMAGARRRVGYDYGGGAYLLTDALPAQDGHRVEDWLTLAAHLGAAASDRTLTLRVSDAERAWAARWLSERGVADGDVLVAMHPGASSPVRRWAPDRFATVASRVAERGAKVLVFEAGSTPGAQWPAGAIVAPGTSLREFMALLAHCHLLVCNDSGPMHIAAALGVATVSLFTAQRPDWYAPEGAAHRFAVVPDFACRPCFDNCVFAEPYCNTSLGVDRVLPLVEAALDRILDARSALVA